MLFIISCIHIYYLLLLCISRLTSLDYFSPSAYSFITFIAFLWLVPFPLFSFHSSHLQIKVLLNILMVWRGVKNKSRVWLIHKLDSQSLNYYKSITFLISKQYGARNLFCYFILPIKWLWNSKKERNREK